MHLSPDDLDALLFGTENEQVHVHLETCAECRALVVADRNIVLALEGLPHLAPRAGFADRVMTRVTVPGAAVEPRRVPAFARAAVLALVFLGGLASSISWSLAQYGTLMAWRDRGLRWALGWFEGGTPRIVAELQRLDWFVAAQSTVGSPIRWAVLLTAVLFVYAAGLLALRRLTALPSSGSATHAA